MPNEEMGGRALPQPADVNSRAILTLVGGSLLFLAAAIAGMLLFLKSQAPGAFAPHTARQFPQPALQTLPQNDLNRYEASQRASLKGYAWVDRDRNIARIPIDEAMRLVAGRGEHAYDALQAVPAPASTSGASP